VTAAFTLYTPRASGLHRLHPLTKLTIAFVGLAASITLPGIWANYALFLLVLVPLAAWGKILPPYLRSVSRVVIPFAISLFVIQGLFWTNGTPVVQLGPLSLKQEGLAFAAQSTGRIMAVVGSFLLLALTTRPDHLMLALSERGVPKTITYVVVTTIQIVPRFQAKASSILDAQHARGLETGGSFMGRVRAVAPLVVPLVLGSIMDVDERAMALEARGFSKSGPKSSLIVLHDPAWERVLRIVLLIGAAALVVARLTVWR
jgi:energy-coupling factor transport system permease protein